MVVGLTKYFSNMATSFSPTDRGKKIAPSSARYVPAFPANRPRAPASAGKGA